VIFVKGHHVAFEMEDGREIVPSASRGMMQDPKGESWPVCSVLVGPYEPTRTPLEHDDTSAHYYGPDYRLRGCRVHLPARSLASWKDRGRVSVIYYVRSGNRAPPRAMAKHRFGTGWEAIFLGQRLATLYARGPWYRLELGTPCVVDDRGFVVP
jgi:hypothetical protein